MDNNDVSLGTTTLSACYTAEAYRRAAPTGRFERGFVFAMKI
jgi:hypothetical protein